MSRSRLSQAIDAARGEDYLRALTLFADIYGSEEPQTLDNARAIEGLSYFGLCIALVQKKYKPAIDLCNRAITLQFYSPEHYVNLTRVYLAADRRKKAIETLEKGLKVSPESEELITLRQELGVRARPLGPVLDRSHPVNVTLGQAKHARKAPKKKPPTGD